MEKTDRELLEAAAKAAGIDVRCVGNGRPNVAVSFYTEPDQLWWNPLTEDGDALRLAVKLDIAPVWGSNRDVVRVDYPARFTIPLYEPVINGDRYAATRRAIVRAAAAMAEQGALGAA